MKVLVLAFPTGTQFRLMYNDAIPPLPDDGMVFLADDYGQTCLYNAEDCLATFTQDTAALDRLEVAMMVRAKTNEIAAMTQLQSNPSNMIVHPGRGMIS